MAGGGSISGMIATLKENSRLKGRSTSRYKNLRSQYTGDTAGSYDGSEYKKLNKEELAEGRKRAKAYYTRRNIRIYTQIVVITLVVLAIVGYLVNAYLLT